MVPRRGLRTRWQRRDARLWSRLRLPQPCRAHGLALGRVQAEGSHDLVEAVAAGPARPRSIFLSVSTDSPPGVLPTTSS